MGPSLLLAVVDLGDCHDGALVDRLGGRDQVGSIGVDDALDDDREVLSRKVDCPQDPHLDLPLGLSGSGRYLSLRGVHDGLLDRIELGSDDRLRCRGGRRNDHDRRWLNHDWCRGRLGSGRGGLDDDRDRNLDPDRHGGAGRRRGLDGRRSRQGSLDDSVVHVAGLSQPLDRLGSRWGRERGGSGSCDLDRLGGGLGLGLLRRNGVERLPGDGCVAHLGGLDLPLGRGRDGSLTASSERRNEEDDGKDVQVLHGGLLGRFDRKGDGETDGRINGDRRTAHRQSGTVSFTAFLALCQGFSI
jgi:hypothetical protein